MAKIIKDRARGFLDAGKPTIGHYPCGVGGMGDNSPCVGIRVGKHAVYMTVAEWQELIADFAFLQRMNIS